MKISTKVLLLTISLPLLNSCDDKPGVAVNGKIDDSRAEHLEIRQNYIKKLDLPKGETIVSFNENKSFITLKGDTYRFYGAPAGDMIFVELEVTEHPDELQDIPEPILDANGNEDVAKEFPDIPAPK